MFAWPYCHNKVLASSFQHASIWPAATWRATCAHPEIHTRVQTRLISVLAFLNHLVQHRLAQTCSFSGPYVFFFKRLWYMSTFYYRALEKYWDTTAWLHASLVPCKLHRLIMI